METYIYEGYTNKTFKKVKPIIYIINQGCWECISHTKSGRGYPAIKRMGKSITIAKYVYENYYNTLIPKDKNGKSLYIRHKCDNIKCINPLHLELGTHADNMCDKIKRNRHTKGESVNTSKLSINNVIIIKQHLKDKLYTQKELALMFNVTPSQISRINIGLDWKDVKTKDDIPYKNKKYKEDNL